MNNAVQLWDGQLSSITTPIPHVLKNVQNEVIVKVGYSGVSGKDLQVLNGEIPCGKTVILGHEFAGVVSEVGSDVKNVTIGDRVVINPYSSCGNCVYCNQGQPHFCEIGGLRTTIGVWRNGGWSQYCRIPYTSVHHLPPQITLRQAVLIEPISRILHAFDQLAPLTSNCDILICGCDIMGLLFASIFHHHGYKKVVVSEVSEGSRKLADSLSYGYCIVHPDHLLSDARKASINKDTHWGFDIIIDCTGNPPSIAQAFKYLRRGGKILLFGNSQKNSKLEIDPFEIIDKELKIMGALINPFTFPRAIQLVRDLGDHYLNYDKLGIKMFPLSGYAGALSSLSKGDISKAVFET